ncbi:O-antigen ligase family protein [Paenibacillus sediminis]|uniref:O-antigen ligase n=1 Tax=Paenibacillus sediminis TaxID=664909 RepID=A0ABS4H3K9_9BACL|nr:O-antigen ligase family protein [Paenibacillus sediminis]MBP1937115.1 O-antigen ligase [Paenibacillus sediminis]
MAVFVLLLEAIAVCLFTGLFFNRDMYSLLFVCSSTAIVMLLPYIIQSSKRRRHLRLTLGFSGPYKWDRVMLFLPWLIALVYGFHLAVSPLSIQGTLNELLRWSWIGLILWMAYMTSYLGKGRQLLLIGWHMMGAVLAVSSILSIYGIISLPHSIMRTGQAEIASHGARLAGLLQYPNTFAVIMGVFTLERLFASASTYKSHTPSSTMFISALPLFPYIVLLLLTESRGAWLSTLIGLLVGAVLLNKDERKSFLIICSTSVFGAVMIYLQLSSVELAPESFVGMLWFCFIWVLSILLTLGLLKLGSGRSLIFRYLSYAASVIMLILGGGSIFFHVKSRLTEHFSTISARTLIFHDALALFNRYPWLGQGGETWRLSMREVQEQPYVGSEVHSGYLDMLLNLGVVGLGLMIFMLFLMSYRLLRARSVMTGCCAVLITHSAVDFDMSYGLTWLLFIWITVLGVPSSPIKRADEGVMWHWTLRNDRITLQRVMMGMAIVVLLGITVQSLRLNMGEHWYIKSLQASASKQSQSLLERSLRWNPYDANPRIVLSQDVNPKEAVTLLKEGLSFNPEHPDLWWQLARAYAQAGENSLVISAVDTALRLDRFNTNKQAEALTLLLDIGIKQYIEGDGPGAHATVMAGIEKYNQYKSLTQLTSKTIHLRNDREFYLTKEADDTGHRLERFARQLSFQTK